MAKQSNETAREKDTLEGGRDRATLPRPTATAARRRRPTSKAVVVETTEERRRAAVARDAKKKTGRGSKQKLLAKPHREDRRDSPSEVDTDAAPKNRKADKNDKKNKGKSTHELEAQAPGTRPSRKSRRGGA